MARALSTMATRIFLSSTGADLQAHRRAVAQAIGLIDGAECVAMETFGPHEAPPIQVCEEMVLSCDLFIGLVGFHFGTAPPASRQSYTQSEYHWASGKERLIWVAPNGSPLPQTEQSGAELDRQRKFRKQLISGSSAHTVVMDQETWSSPYSLANSVLIALFKRLRAPGYTEEQHRAKLRLRERELRTELAIASRQALREREAELEEHAAKIRNRLANLEADFKATCASLTETRNQLARLDNWVGREQMRRALDALDSGDPSVAASILADVSRSWQERIIEPSREAAVAEFRLGEIAERTGSLLTADTHFANAARLAVNNPIYQMKWACSRLNNGDSQGAAVYGATAMGVALKDRTISRSQLIELTYDLAFILSNTGAAIEHVNAHLTSCTHSCRELYGDESREYAYFILRRAEYLSGKRLPPRTISCP